MTALLQVSDLHVHYGKSHIIQGLSFAVQEGEVVCLLGRNGAGRSTTLKAVIGLVAVSGGAICLRGEIISGLPPYEIAQRGCAYVPEERDVFKNLTVEENLQLGVSFQKSDRPRWSVDQMYDYFPRLKERRGVKAGDISGGEQQMLTLCRSLLTNPSIILIDEPTEGLAPKIVEDVAAFIRDIHRRGVSVVLVEQKLVIAFEISDRALVMGHGQIVFDGSVDDLRGNEKVIREWISV